MSDLSLTVADDLTADESCESNRLYGKHEVVIDLTIQDQRDIEITLESEMVA